MITKVKLEKRICRTKFYLTLLLPQLLRK